MIGVELRALQNAWRSPEGRGEVAGNAVVLLCLVLGSLALGASLLRTDVVAALRDDSTGAMLAVVVAFLLVPPLVVTLSFAKLPCRHALFSAPWLPLLLTSPVASWRVVAIAWFRVAAGTAVVVLALVAAPAVGLTLRAGVPPLAAGLVVAVGVMLGAALVAVVMAVLVAVTRWCSGPRLRRALTVVHLALATAAIVLLLGGFVRGPALRDTIVAFDPGASSLGHMVRLVADLPVALATGEVSARAFATPLACVAIIVLGLGFAAASHRRAYEASLVRAPAGRLRAASRAWPVTPLRSLLLRAALESWRARGNVALVALIAVVAVWRVASDQPAVSADDSLPLLREVFFLLQSWLMLAFVMVLVLFLGVVGDEQKQLPLLATSPLARRDLLASRLVLVGWPFVMTMVLMALTGLSVTGLAWTAVVGFVFAAVPLLLVLLGSAVAVGSWPRFIRVHDDMPLANNLRSVVPVLVLSAIAGGSTFVVYEVADAVLGAASDGPSPAVVASAVLTAAWLVGGVWLWGSCRIAHRNLERLLGPQ